MHADSTATRRPTASTFKPRVRRLGPGRYLVESKTTPGIGHQADLTRNTCSCTAGKWGRPACRHRTLAAQVDASLTRWYAQAVPVEATPPAVPFHQTRGFQRLAEAFA